MFLAYFYTKLGKSWGEKLGRKVSPTPRGTLHLSLFMLIEYVYQVATIYSLNMGQGVSGAAAMSTTCTIFNISEKEVKFLLRCRNVINEFLVLVECGVVSKSLVYELSFFRESVQYMVYQEIMEGRKITAKQLHRLRNSKSI